MKIIRRKLSNAAKETKKNLSNFAKSLKDNFVIEGGIGYGAGLTSNVGKSKSQLGGYIDITKSSKNGQIVDTVTGNIGASVGNIGLSMSKSHEYPFDPEEPGLKHDILEFDVIARCEKTETHYSFDIGLFHFGDTGSFFGYESEKHVIAGYHFRIGWEF